MMTKGNIKQTLKDKLKDCDKNTLGRMIMENRINVAELLKDCPKGYELEDTL